MLASGATSFNGILSRIAAMTKQSNVAIMRCDPPLMVSNTHWFVRYDDGEDGEDVRTMDRCSRQE